RLRRTSLLHPVVTHRVVYAHLPRGCRHRLALRQEFEEFCLCLGSIGSAHAASVRGNRLVLKPWLVQRLRYKFHALVSIDGQSDIHDLLRPRKDGSGSYTAASNSVVRLKSGGVDTAIEAVYTRAHYLKGVTPLSMMSHFRTLGVREFQISLAVGDWHAEDLIPEISDVAELFATACRQSVRSLRTTEPFL